MSLFTNLANKYQVLSVIGMAKIPAKTTTLNYLIDEAYNEDLILGVTSTGRDGEGRDLVTGTEKPKVYLTEDTLVSIPKALYEVAEAGLEIMKMSDLYTTFGQIMICKVVEPGYVQIAGPTSTLDQRALAQEMLAMGAEMVIIDGAIDRRSIANPDASDAVILATGAVVSRNIDVVAAETGHIVNLYSLPLLEDKGMRGDLEGQDSMVIYKDGKEQVQSCRTGLMTSEEFDKMIDKEADYLYIPGALTSQALEHVFPEKIRRVTFIVKDPTKIFIDRLAWNKLRKRGLKVVLMQGIQVAAIAVNPYSPQGYAFDRKTLLARVSSLAGDIPVIDVKDPHIKGGI